MLQQMVLAATCLAATAPRSLLMQVALGALRLLRAGTIAHRSSSLDTAIPRSSYATTRSRRVTVLSRRCGPFFYVPGGQGGFIL